MSDEDQTADLKIVHLDWLVNSRRKNQECTLSLYKTIIDHNNEIVDDNRNYYVAQALASACFSLWRAAFLSDITTDGDAAVNSMKMFLRQILASNMIGFTQDLGANHYTFRYYTGVAQDQMTYIFNRFEDMHVVREAPNNHPGDVPMEYWDVLQGYLTTAVGNFGQYLRAERAAQIKA